MKWLIENYKWLFDGAAIAAVIFVAQIFVNRRKRGRPSQKESSTLIAKDVSDSVLASGFNISQNINSPTLNFSLPAPTSGTPARERYDEWREIIDEIHEALDQMANAFLPFVERRVGDDSWDFRAGIRRGNRVLHNRILIAASLERSRLTYDWDDLVRQVQGVHENPDRWDKRSPTMGGFYEKASDFQERLIRVAREDMQSSSSVGLESHAIESGVSKSIISEESPGGKLLKEHWKIIVICIILISILTVGFVWGYREPTASPPQMSENHGTSDSVTAVVKRDWHNKNNWRQYLRLGMTKNEVRQLFGEPESVRVYSEIETWNYGSGEVQFYNELLDAWNEPSL